MQEECLICGAPLKYLEQSVPMECTLCHKQEPSKTLCTAGHYVCSSCHSSGAEMVPAFCLAHTSADPVRILNDLMALPFCHMHGPEHHILVGSALLTAYKNAGGQLDLPAALAEMQARGKEVPGGACGFWGACGAGISSGIFVSILSGSTPLSAHPFSLCHQMTADSLQAIARVGGPRCCKRDSYLSVLAAVDFAARHLGVQMETHPVRCHYTAQNNQCLGGRCPFFPAGKEEV